MISTSVLCSAIVIEFGCLMKRISPPLDMMLCVSPFRTVTLQSERVKVIGSEVPIVMINYRDEKEVSRETISSSPFCFTAG